MRIAGVILIILGFLFSLSIVGAIIGIPLMLIGFVMVVFGGGRKTVVTNVVQVSNAVSSADSGWIPAPAANKVELGQMSEPSRLKAPPVQPPMAAAPVRERLAPTIEGRTNFRDIEHEITEDSISILRNAKLDGCDVRYEQQANRVVVTPLGGRPVVLTSNVEIWQFGQRFGYFAG